MQYKLNNKWILWFHNSKNNWKKSGYTKLLELDYLEEIALLINNFNKLGGLFNNHFIIMRDGINLFGKIMLIKMEAVFL